MVFSHFSVFIRHFDDFLKMKLLSFDKMNGMRNMKLIIDCNYPIPLFLENVKK